MRTQPDIKSRMELGVCLSRAALPTPLLPHPTCPCVPYEPLNHAAHLHTLGWPSPFQLRLFVMMRSFKLHGRPRLAGGWLSPELDMCSYGLNACLGNHIAGQIVANARQLDCLGSVL